MLPFLLLLAGGGVSFYCLWQFRRWLGEPDEGAPAGAQRLEVLVDELVATAEATSAVVQEKADELIELIGQADRRIGALREAVEPAPAPVAAPVAAEAAPGPGALHQKVYALADAGSDVTAIARQLGLTKGEVQLILGLRK